MPLLQPCVPWPQLAQNGQINVGGRRLHWGVKRTINDISARRFYFGRAVFKATANKMQPRKTLRKAAGA